MFLNGAIRKKVAEILCRMFSVSQTLVCRRSHFAGRILEVEQSNYSLNVHIPTKKQFLIYSHLSLVYAHCVHRKKA